MTNKLSARQAGLIIFVVMLCNKMLSLNSLISYHTLNNAWIVFFISFVIDFLFVLIFIYFIKIMDKPILEYVKEKFGKTFSIILAILVAILFLFRLTQIMVDIYLFFVQLIYAEIDRVIFTVCFLTITFYFGTRKLRSLGRTAEILISLIAGSLVLSFLMSMKAIEFEKLLPFFSVNFMTIGRSIVVHNLWFGDFLVFFFFIGNVKMEKNTAKTLMLSYSISCAVVLLFTIIFTCAFGNTASLHRVSVIDITEFNPRVTAQGRFNWLVYFMFPIALVMGIGIYAKYITLCIDYCMKDSVKNKTTVCGLLTTAAILAMFFAFRFTYTAFYQFVTGGFYFYTIAVQYVLPIVLLGIINIKELTKNKKILKNKQKTLKNSKKTLQKTDFSKIDNKFSHMTVNKKTIDKRQIRVTRKALPKAVKT